MDEMITVYLYGKKYTGNLLIKLKTQQYFKKVF